MAVSIDKARVSEWDFFICHAGEDREEVVEPLARELARRGYRVWYDQWELAVGDNLRRRIDEGLSRSRFGIVVLSPSFFGKGWPQWELDGLVRVETAGRDVILPVWHDVTARDVSAYSPSLAGRLAVSTTEGILRVADRLAGAAARPRHEPSVETPPEDDTRRGKRGEVLEAISAFRAIVESLCAGFRPAPDDWLRIAGELAEANAEVRRILDRNSPWLDLAWVDRVERLEKLGLKIALEARLAQTGGPAQPGGAGDLSRWCREFKACFHALRGGEVRAMRHRIHRS